MVTVHHPTVFKPPDGTTDSKAFGFKQQKVISEALENTEKYQEEGKDHPKFPHPAQIPHSTPTSLQPISENGRHPTPGTEGLGDNLACRITGARASLANPGLRSPGRPGPRAFTPASALPGPAPSLPGRGLSLGPLQVLGSQIEKVSPAGPVLSGSPPTHPVGLDSVCVLCQLGHWRAAASSASLGSSGGSARALCRPHPELPLWPLDSGRTSRPGTAPLLPVGTLLHRLTSDPQTVRWLCSHSDPASDHLAKVHSSVSERLGVALRGLPSPHRSRHSPPHHCHPLPWGSHLSRTQHSSAQLGSLTLVLPAVNRTSLLPQTPGPSLAAHTLQPAPSPPPAICRGPAPGSV